MIPPDPRATQIWLWRAEGLTWTEIARRLEVNRGRPREIVQDTPMGERSLGYAVVVLDAMTRS